MEIFLHHGIPQLMNFNRLLKFGFICQSNIPQKHIKERLLQLAVHQLTKLDGISKAHVSSNYPQQFSKMLLCNAAILQHSISALLGMGNGGA